MASHARVAELVDAHDSKSCSARSGGSIPSTGTNRLYHSISYRLIDYDKGRTLPDFAFDDCTYYYVYHPCISARLGVFSGVLKCFEREIPPVLTDRAVRTSKPQERPYK